MEPPELDIPIEELCATMTKVYTPLPFSFVREDPTTHIMDNVVWTENLGNCLIKSVTCGNIVYENVGGKLVKTPTDQQIENSP